MDLVIWKQRITRIITIPKLIVIEQYLFNDVENLSQKLVLLRERDSNVGLGQVGNNGSLHDRLPRRGLDGTGWWFRRRLLLKNEVKVLTAQASQKDR